ncbi:MAG: hypothetical protein IT459_09680 [Planctomycetes bacterium]|nr:hypothetical protein [Planctomycetota bacterium]
MDPKQQEAALDDVDRKIERLRASYDQYFMGLERIAPSEARRDVDRRLRKLREENLRNTATKFRFQTLLARFITFTGYWDRITRQIEEGTFKRDVDRAKQRIGTAAQKPRISELELDVDIDLEMSGDEDNLEAAIDAAIREAEQEEERLSLTSIVPEPPTPRAGPPPVPRTAAIRASVFTDEDFAAIDSAFDTMQLRDSLPPTAARPAGARVSAVPSAPTTGTAARPEELKDTTARKPSARFARPKELEAPIASASPASGATSLPRASSLLDDPPTEGPSTDKVPRVALDAPTPPATPAARAQPTAALPPPAAPTATPAARSAARFPPPTGKMSAPPVAPTAKSPSLAAQARPGGSVDDETRKLYARYVEMRRACNESTDNVRIESLAKNLQEIRKKHGGRDIAFEVVVKDGRAAIKPVPR